MIILYCTDSLVAGGAEQQLTELIRRLDRRRFAPFVVCLYGEKAGRSEHYRQELQALDVPVITLDVRGKAGLLASVIRVVWRLQPDLVQTVNYHSNLLMHLARPFLPWRVKLVAGIYTAYSRKQLMYERLSAWLCDALVCNSPAIQRKLTDALYGRSVELIPNGVDIERFGCSPDPGLRERLASGASFVLLFMGRVTRQKGVYLIVEALGMLARSGQLPAGVQFWIVGECDENEVLQLEDAVQQWGLQEVIRQFPVTYQPEAYYHAADVLILPSLSEGLPNVILESLVAARPVVVSEAANAAGVVRDGETGWIVRTKDAVDLADKLAEVLSMSPNKRVAMGDLCQLVAARFGADRMADAYMTLYERLSRRS